MPVFNVTRTKTTLVPGEDLLTIVASALKPLTILKIDLKGMGNASAANEIVVQRSTSGTTPGGAITAEDAYGGGATAGFSAYTTWAAQPSLSGSPLWRFAPNANGGIDKDVALPGGEMRIPAGGKLSIRPLSGSTSQVVLNIQIDEW